MRHGAYIGEVYFLILLARFGQLSTRDERG